MWFGCARTPTCAGRVLHRRCAAPCDGGPVAAAAHHPRTLIPFVRLVHATLHTAPASVHASTVGRHAAPQGVPAVATPRVTCRRREKESAARRRCSARKQLRARSRSAYCHRCSLLLHVRAPSLCGGVASGRSISASVCVCVCSRSCFAFLLWLPLPPLLTPPFSSDEQQRVERVVQRALPHQRCARPHATPKKSVSATHLTNGNGTPRRRPKRRAPGVKPLASAACRSRSRSCSGVSGSPPALLTCSGCGGARGSGCAAGGGIKYPDCAHAHTRARVPRQQNRHTHAAQACARRRVRTRLRREGESGRRRRRPRGRDRQCARVPVRVAARGRHEHAGVGARLARARGAGRGEG
jgi:hypothetical protein